jgi:hypothetical protein
MCINGLEKNEKANDPGVASQPGVGCYDFENIIAEKWRKNGVLGSKHC